MRLGSTPLSLGLGSPCSRPCFRHKYGSVVLLGLTWPLCLLTILSRGFEPAPTPLKMQAASVDRWHLLRQAVTEHLLARQKKLLPHHEAINGTKQAALQHLLRQGTETLAVAD